MNNDSASKDDVREILEYAMAGRRRVKEQLKKIGGIEFYDVNFSYIDTEDGSEHFVTVTESGGSKLIPEGMGKPGQVFLVNRNNDGKIGVYKFELQVVAGSGKYEKSGIGSSSKAKEAVKTTFNYFKANAKSVSQSISTKEKDYQLHVQDLTVVGMTDGLALPAFISLCSGALEKPLQEQIVVLGSFTIGGSVSVIDNLSDLLQVCRDAGAKKVLIPISSAGKISAVPPDLFSKFQISFYEDPIDAVYKSLAL